MQEKKHIQYLDVLKGVVISLVVVGHAFHFGFAYYRSPLLHVLKSIDMPVFLFLSGMLGATALSFDRESVKSYWVKKARQLLLPLCTLPFIYALMFGIDLKHLLLDRMHGGYWFTLVLFEMFALVYALRYINSLINPNGKVWIELALASTSLGLALSISPIWQELHSPSWEALSWGKLDYLYAYFLIGYFAGKYKELEAFISNHKVGAIAGLIFVICIYLETTSKQLLAGVPASLSGLVMAYSLAKTAGNSDSKLNRFWAYLGKESRTIYLTHYFLLFSAPMVGTFLKTGLKGADRIFLWEASLASIYATVVITATLLLVKMLKSNPYTNTLFYGKVLKPNKPIRP